VAEITEAIAGTHCACRGGMARLSWPAWLVGGGSPAPRLSFTRYYLGSAKNWFIDRDKRYANNTPKHLSDSTCHCADSFCAIASRF